MFDNSFLLWFLSRCDGISERVDAEQVLVKFGWEVLGNGAEQRVWGKKGVPFVLKFSMLGCFTFEYFSRQLRKRAEMVEGDDNFAQTQVFGFPKYFVSVQERVDTCLHGIGYDCRKGHQKIIDEVSSKYNFRDIRRGNVGLIGGKLKIYDWQIDEW